MIILPFLSHTPHIGERMRAPASAAVIGRAEIGPDCTLGHLALVRADGEEVHIGADCWFGEASTVHIAHLLYPSIVGAHVTVGRYALVHACTIGDDCVIGEHATVMDGAVLGAGAVVAAQSVVPPGKKLDGGWLYAGAPARPVAPVAAPQLKELHRALRAPGAIDRTGAAAEVVLAVPSLPGLRHRPGTGAAGHFPPGAYVAPNASVVGAVVLGERASVWFGVEIDAGAARIEIGAETNVQDNSRIYAGPGAENVRIGERVLIGHNVRIFASTIGDAAIIGMGAIVGPGTVVEPGGCVAAGSATEPGTVVRSGEVWSGRPARAARALSEANRAAFADGVMTYVEYASQYLGAASRGND